MGYSDKILEQNLNPSATYQEIRKAIWVKYFPVSAGDDSEFWRRVFTMSRGECAFILTDHFVGEINMNGFDLYFYNTGDRHAKETVEALRLFGLSEAADYLSRAIQIARIPDPRPANQDFQGSEAITKALNELDSEYFSANADHRQYELVTAYVRQHPDEFA